MTDPGINPAEEFAGSPREERLGELINEFFDRRESGENLSEDEFLAQYPDFAPDLRDHFRGLELLEGLGSSSARQTLSHGGAQRFKGSSAGMHGIGDERPLPEIPGYDMLKEIGRGGMGVVFKALQISTRRVVALKLLLEGQLASETARRRFEREVALAAQLRHPNIIPIYDSGEAEGRMFYAMEHVYGMPLSDYFRVHSTSIEGKLRLFIRISDAVRHAHLRGVVHRDLKPSNILVDADGEPHVLDFGLAKASAFGDLSASITAQIVGTPAYMSPEQAAGDPSGLDTRTDIYSLGVILYECTTDRMPYDTTGAMGKILANIADAEPIPPNKANPKLNPDLAAIILKALQKRKEDRYQSIDAFMADMANFLAGEPISAKPPSGLFLLRRTFWRYRAPIGICAAVILFAIALTIMFRTMRSSIAQSQVAQQEAQEAQVQALQQAEQVARLEQDVQDLQAQREAAEHERRVAEMNLQEFKYLVEKADPELAQTLEPVMRSLGKSIASGEGSAIAIPTAIAALLSQAEADAPRTRTKSWTLEPEANVALGPSSSARPPWAAPKPAEATAPKEDITQKVLQTLWNRMKTGPELAPTSQPADDTGLKPGSFPPADGNLDKPADSGEQDTPPTDIAPPQNEEPISETGDESGPSIGVDPATRAKVIRALKARLQASPALLSTTQPESDDETAGPTEEPDIEPASDAAPRRPARFEPAEFSM